MNYLSIDVATGAESKVFFNREFDIGSLIYDQPVRFCYYGPHYHGLP